MTLIDQLDEIAERLAASKDRDMYDLAQILRRAMENANLATDQIKAHIQRLAVRLDALEKD